ncbi:density lipoprotein receptor adapter 1-like [Octopus vulgaris]|uniref:Density lipoprotein receptor adapter 1-like n=3 Tax=Octopus TaxID=6643 RepID=A0AA36B333_OCTVU|nr:low density lipoprotein receptor adapter protein 1-B [Octopus bimaculoides]XP_029639856.1 low density lipoprotein receptor adapter protein 1-B [Octopus sinensis]CAI9727036.1 density lipoprotein receptor adapter 1-like [Octopus vulgaris]|eukprot:XP_014782080.1 PREDICTED: low density lipoprotein receptor adapter protein 1-B-like [Octopus bimaculoides]
MDVLFRVVRRSPTVFSSFKRHHKLHDKWGENLDTVNDGLTFYLKYLGSTLVEEISEGESYGDGISTKAIQRVIAMEKNSGKKWRKVALNVSSQGIKMYDMVTKEMLLDVCIYRISFCTADRHHERVFAFIARNTINETMECYVYVCPKRKIAHDVTLTVSQSFSIAEYLELEEEQEERRKAEKEDNRIYASDLIEIPEDDLMPSYRRKLSDSVTSSDASTPMNLSPPSNSPCINLQDFDEEEDNLDDCFSRLAEYRSRLRPTPFTTDFIKADIETDVGHYLKNNNRCFEDYVCPKTVEDLLLL